MARLTDNLRVETTVGRQGIVVDVDVKNKAAGLLAVAHDNTMDGIGTPDDPLRVNTDVIATKEDLAKFAKFSIEVVDELPEVGRDNVIYFVPKDGAAPDVHDEYVWTNGAFELIGSTQVDLTGYVKFTDYATAGNAGVVKVYPTDYSISCSGNGYLRADPTSLEKYTAGNDYRFIGKGTLENIKKDIVERAVSEDGATLSGYVKDTDYAGDTGGIIKVSSIYGLQVNKYNNGYMSGFTVTLDKYTNDQLVISRGTLENIKYDLLKRSITTNDIALTDEEKAAAQAWLGIDTLVGDISTALSAILGE